MVQLGCTGGWTAVTDTESVGRVHDVQELPTHWAAPLDNAIMFWSMLCETRQIGEYRDYLKELC